MFKGISVIGLMLLSLLWLRNTSLFLRPAEDTTPKLIAHRGVHQTFNTRNIGRDDCTAILIEDSGHTYLENTLESMQAAFAYGADVVELDIQPTSDGEFVVFHDWTLDCRTNGKGDVRKAALAHLQNLDIGYGYTFDGGEIFPFRGRGVGKMPTLSQVFAGFPDGKFLINFKGNDSDEGKTFVTFMRDNPEWLSNVWGVYGGAKPTEITIKVLAVKGYSRQSAKACLKNYALKGWAGYVPKSCRNTIVIVPQNYAKYMWGWPHRFSKRLKSAGSEVILLGAHTKGNAGSTGIDDAESLRQVPKGFDGFIWSNKIELVGPLLEAKPQN